MRRFSFDYIPDINKMLQAPKEIINHLNHVLRLKINDTIEATDGSGYIYIIKIYSIDDNQIFLKVISKERGKEIPLNITAFIGELKNDAMDNTISILAEHGIQNIIPFFSERSISKLNNKQILKKQERRQRIIKESVKKVGGLYSCSIQPSISFKDIPNYSQNISQKVLFWENETSSSSQLSHLDYSKDITFIIGVEGGFSQNEITYLLSQGFLSYSLGTRILRSPQAASAASIILRYFTESNYK